MHHAPNAYVMNYASYLNSKPHHTVRPTNFLCIGVYIISAGVSSVFIKIYSEPDL